MVLGIAEVQNNAQNAVVQPQHQGTIGHRAVVNLTRSNRSDFQAGAGPINLELFTWAAVASTVVATLAVGIATLSLTKTGITALVGAVATAIIHQYDK